MTGTGVEMMLVPFHGQGHIFPCTQLSLQLAARGVTVTVVVPSEVAPSISAACNHPLVRIAELSLPPSPPDAPPQHMFLRTRFMVEPFTELIARRAAPGPSDPPPPICVVIDALVGWAVDICQRHALPSAVFFTNGTAACALEYIGYHLPLDDLNPDEPVSIEGLPDSLGLTYGDLIHKPPRGQMPPPTALAGVGPPPSFPGGGPPGGRRFPPWVPEVEGATAFLFNTCDELERPFIECIARESKKKAFGVGPLLPPQLWESAGAPLRDGAVRAKKSSGISEEEVEAWLASKPRGSVVFVSFGSEVSPSVPELADLAAGLEESGLPFIWVIQPNAMRAGSPFGAPAEDPWSCVVPEGFEKRVEGRGLVVRGWAPQLLILSHPSTGGFLSHCGWNSTLEALVHGVPILAWPIRGDQHQTATLVANYLRVGFKIRSARGREVSKEDVLKGLEKLMGDAEGRRRSNMGQVIACIQDKLHGKEWRHQQLRKITDRVFVRVKTDSEREHLTFEELYIAVLFVYNDVNKHIPGPHIDPPPKEKVKTMMEVCDFNLDGVLNREEFYQFIKKLTADTLDIVSRNLIIALVLAPTVAILTKRATEGVPGIGKVVQKLPNSIYASVIALGVLVLENVAESSK